MNALEAKTIQCPYCWEMFDITIDCSVSSQEYVEDCEVCCQPILMKATVSSAGIPDVEVSRES
jgi:hypothetical protein